MKWFYDLKIGTKLLVGFVLVALIAGIVGWIGIINIHTIENADTELYKVNTKPLAEIGDVAVAFQRIRVNIRGMLINQDGSNRDKYLSAIKELDQKIDSDLTDFAKSVDNKEVRQELDSLRSSIASYAPVREKIIAFASAGQVDKAVSLMNGEGYALAKAIEDSIRKLFELEIALAEQKADQNTIIANNASRGMLILMVFVIALAVGLGVFISRLISIPVSKMTEAANRIALGSVDMTVEAKSGDEIGEMAKAFNIMVENIREQTKLAEQIAQGDLNVRFKAKSEEDILSKSLNDIVEALKNLDTEAVMLTKAAVDGQLDIRGEVGKFQGIYREILGGINNTLDAVIEPVKEAAAVLAEMEKGNLNVKMTGQYKGDHALIKTALNETITIISGYVKEISQVLTELSKGNLTVEINRYYKGDFVEMKEALNLIIKSLNGVLGEINMAAEQVASGSRQVSGSSQALSQGSTEQASSIEEISASMTEVAAQTKQNALNANQANELAVKAKDDAAKGNYQMKEMLQSMEEINDSSASISKIIKVIDEIAFQTNLLALNAAVEAARAGQHGKGFAVVAEEVRNLAARSANAAKETTVMIEGSIKKVDVGTKLAQETAEALNKIVGGVSEVASLVGNIAAASNEQANGITQINQAITQVDKVVQMTTATAEESASASEELSSQAELLKDMVNKFKLRQAGAAINSLNGLNPNIIKMLEGMAEKEQAAPSSSKIKISLDDQEFGKY